MYRLILVRFDRDTGRFEDEEFNKFCTEQSIVRIEKEFINTGGEIYYSFFIEYVSRKVCRGKTSTDDLSELELAQYNALRDWRNELASGEGIPAYIIMYNS
ncbi:MAG: HRDC domain-containing protein, partial [Sphaerochaetaceae bacterium]|nr:HRDC domain-containing protein [Sphaerochaetaceae bacterium]